MDAVVRIGEKGQIVIPKILRDQFGMLPGTKVAVQEKPEGLLVRHADDPLAIFFALARKSRKKSFQVHAIEEQYAYRAKRAGIKL